MSGDPRLIPARADLASAALEGIVRATRYAEAAPHRVVAPRAALRASPDEIGEQIDQVIFGETFEVLEVRGAFAWGQASRDGYVAWAPLAALSRDLWEPTHRVTALRTFAFAEPSIKSAPFGPLSLNALVTVTEKKDALVQVPDAGWIAAAHLAPIGADFAAPADTAERFLGAPYLWGGRDSLGLDCSGLVQQAFWAAGLACPRDSDQQARMGVPADAEARMRGDLVFWRGHVAMMLDAERLIHANAHHMAVAIESLRDALTRIAAKGGGDPIARRRVQG